MIHAKDSRRRGWLSRLGAAASLRLVKRQQRLTSIMSAPGGLGDTAGQQVRVDVGYAGVPGQRGEGVLASAAEREGDSRVGLVGVSRVRGTLKGRKQYLFTQPAPQGDEGVKDNFLG